MVDNNDKTGAGLDLKTTDSEDTDSASQDPQNTQNNDQNTLTSLKQKNKYLRKASTQTSNLLRSQMENNVKTTATESTYAKLTQLNDELSNITSILLTLPETTVPSGTL